MSSPSPAFLSPALRNISLTLLAAGAAVSLSACGLVASFLGEGNVMELGVGDCFNEEDMFSDVVAENEEVSEVPLIDCAEPHNAEFFHSEELPDGDFPGDAAMEASSEAVCSDSAFEEFVGVAPIESELFVGSLRPTVETWEILDDREILCYVVTDGEPVTGSFEGSKR